jgi:hypothetical protein
MTNIKLEVDDDYFFLATIWWFWQNMENLASGGYAISIVGGCTASFAAFSYFSTLSHNVADLKSQLAKLHSDSKYFSDRLDANNEKSDARSDKVFLGTV